MTTDNNPTMPADDDPWAAIDSQLDKDPSRTDSWDPEPGERLRGIVKEITYKKTGRGSVLPIVSIETRDGDVVPVLAGRKLLVTRLLEAKVQPGDLVGIQYDGLIEPKGGGQPYYGYRVACSPIDERGPDVFQDPETVKLDPNSDLLPGSTNPDPWNDDEQDPPAQEAGF